MTKLAVLAILWSAGFATACNRQAPVPTLRAQAGIFFGGQIQNRTEWPLTLDETRQTQGFRIDFGQVLQQPAHVTWDVVRPAVKPRKHTASSNESAASSFDVTVPTGTDRFDQLVRFNDGDRPGQWKLHVFVNGTSVLDRTIQVVAKSSAGPDD